MAAHKRQQGQQKSDGKYGSGLIPRRLDPARALQKGATGLRECDACGAEIEGSCRQRQRRQSTTHTGNGTARRDCRHCVHCEFCMDAGPGKPRWNYCFWVKFNAFACGCIVRQSIIEEGSRFSPAHRIHYDAFCGALCGSGICRSIDVPRRGKSALPASRSNWGGMRFVP